MLGQDEILVLIGVDDKIRKELPSSIICLSRTESIEELVLWYNLADVILSLSKAETFGITIAEAMACGTPAVVYSNTALPELIICGTGHVVRDGYVEGVYQRIQQIKNEGSGQYVRGCRVHAQKEFNQNNRFNDYIKLYNSILAE